MVFRLLWFFLLFLPGFFPGLPVLLCGAQPTTFQQRAFHVKLEYNRHSAGRYRPLDLIMREIALEVLREPWRVDLQVRGKIQLSLPGNGYTRSLQIRFPDLRMEGDTVFRGFSIVPWLSPSTATVVILMANRDDTTSYRELLLMCNLRDSSVMAEGYPLHDFNARVDTLLIRSLSFHYDSLDWEEFRAGLKLIHNYHASLTVLDSLFRISDEIDLSERSRLPWDYFRIIEINRALECINAYRFDTSLLRYNPDRLNLAGRYRDGYRTGRTLTYNFLDALKNKETIQFQGTMSRWVSFLTERTMQWIYRTQWMDKLQGDVYMNFLWHRFGYEPFPEEQGVTGTLLHVMFPDASADTLENYFHQSVYMDFQSKVRSLTAAKRYSEARLLMACAQRWAAFMKIPVDTMTGYGLLRTATEGVFDSYVGIAEGCIQTGNSSMADHYLNMAANYRRGHGNLIRDDSGYRAVFSRLFFSRNRECDELLAANRYGEALDCYAELEGRYTHDYLTALSGSLEERKNRARSGLYDLTMEDATRALRSSEPEKALVLFETAEELRAGTPDSSLIVPPGKTGTELELAGLRMHDRYEEAVTALEKRQFTLALSLFGETREWASRDGLKLPVGFDSLYRRNVKHFLLVQLSHSQKRIWVSEFDSAEAALERTRQTMTANGLIGDTDLDTAMARFSRKISEQQCINAIDSAMSRLIRAEKSIQFNRYIQAKRLFAEADSIFLKFPGCSHEGLSPVDSIRKYDPPAEFQQNLENAGTAVVMGNYAEALRWLKEWEGMYHRLELSRFFSSAPNLFAYINDRGNPYLTASALEDYTAAGDITEAIRYLKLFCDQLSDPGQTNRWQEQLAMMAATSDMAAEPEGDPNLLLSRYQLNETTFPVFRKKYLNVWKTVRK